MSVLDFIAARAAPPVEEKPKEAMPMAPTSTDMGEMMKAAAQEIQKAGPEIVQWLHGAAGAAGDLKEILASLKRIEKLLGKE